MSSDEAERLLAVELDVITYELSDVVEAGVLPGALAVYIAELTLLFARSRRRLRQLRHSRSLRRTARSDTNAVSFFGPEQFGAIGTVRAEDWVLLIELRRLDAVSFRKVHTCVASDGCGKFVASRRYASLHLRLRGWVSACCGTTGTACRGGRHVRSGARGRRDGSAARSYTDAVALFRLEQRGAICSFSSEDWVPLIQLLWFETVCLCKLDARITIDGCGEQIACRSNAGLCFRRCIATSTGGSIRTGGGSIRCHERRLRKDIPASWRRDADGLTGCQRLPGCDLRVPSFQLRVSEIAVCRSED
jgi:hypothetical protein